MSRRESPKRVRLRPRISVAKMGEYLTVPAHRRERILYDQKYPADYITTRYRGAYAAIRSSLLAGGDVVGRLLEKARLIENAVTTKPYEAAAKEGCAQAIQRFAKLYPGLRLEGLTPAIAGNQGFSLDIEGVEISVAPVVLLRRVKRDGSEETGALLLAISKGVKLSDHSGRAVAEILRQALVQGGLVSVRPKLCMVVDIFARGVFVAPPRNQRLTSEIESACREIAVRWPAIAA